MSTTPNSQPVDYVERLVRSVLTELPPSETWSVPAGYRDSLALATIDSVYSLRSRYSTVEAVLARYRTKRGAEAERDSLSDLRGAIRRHGGPENSADTLFKNTTRAGNTGKLKSLVIDQAAEALLAIGIDSADDLRARLEAPEPARDAKLAWTRVKGLGPESWYYVTMHVGAESAKIDTHLRSYLARAWECTPAALPSDARTLLGAAASELGVTSRTLDHAIWNFERDHKRGAGR